MLNFAIATGLAVSIAAIFWAILRSLTWSTRRWPNAVPAISCLLLLSLIAWRAAGPPIRYHSGLFVGNLTWLQLPEDPALQAKALEASGWDIRESYDLRFATRGHWTHLSIPYPLAVAMTSILPLWWLCKRLPWPHGPLPGHCRHCGYDLRATPLRCPECGEVPDA